MLFDIKVYYIYIIKNNVISRNISYKKQTTSTLFAYINFF